MPTATRRARRAWISAGSDGNQEFRKLLSRPVARSRGAIGPVHPISRRRAPSGSGCETRYSVRTSDRSPARMFPSGIARIQGGRNCDADRLRRSRAGMPSLDGVRLSLDAVHGRVGALVHLVRLLTLAPKSRTNAERATPDSSCKRPTAACIRASRCAIASWDASRTRAANSSPPTLASVSPLRITPASAALTSMISRSPCEWPHWSLTSFSPSTSTGSRTACALRSGGVPGQSRDGCSDR